MNAPKLSKFTMKYRFTAGVGVIACNLTELSVVTI